MVFEAEVEEEVMVEGRADAHQLLGVDAAHSKYFVHMGAGAANLGGEPADAVSLLARYLLYTITYVHKKRGSGRLLVPLS